MKALLFRTLIVTHRYIGIAIGWLMLLWCLSGIVMMYVRYPELQQADARAALSTLDVTRCCAVPEDLFAADERIAAVKVSMLSGHPVLQVEPDFGPGALLNLQTGQALTMISASDALQVAQQYATTAGLSGKPRLLALLERDQWTVYASYDNDRPLYRVALDDAAGTQVYVSSISGALVQKTDRSQRFWNWLGAVPHWLYFTALRENAVMWTRVVIWSSVLGTFLAGFGLYLGVWQLRRRAGRLHSPYRGWNYWHHVPGLLFGTLVLTWVLSGLLSMNPWGWLETQGAGNDARRLRGELPTWTMVRESLQTLPNTDLPLNVVSLEASVLHGELAFLATTRQGPRQRLDKNWMAGALTEPEIAQANQALSPTASWSLLTTEDTYYYSHGRDRVTLPVLRVMANDAQATRYYLDPLSGELLRKVDGNARWYRWLHSGLHRLDFNPVFRMRPFWDLLMWLSLLGGALVCATGTWLGIKRLRGRPPRIV